VEWVYTTWTRGQVSLSWTSNSVGREAQRSGRVRPLHGAEAHHGGVLKRERGGLLVLTKGETCQRDEGDGLAAAAGDS
jgi:hypothetical protein